MGWKNGEVQGSATCTYGQGAIPSSRAGAMAPQEASDLPRCGPQLCSSHLTDRRHCVRRQTSGTSLLPDMVLGARAASATLGPGHWDCTHGPEPWLGNCATVPRACWLDPIISASLFIFFKQELQWGPIGTPPCPWSPPLALPTSPSTGLPGEK